MGYFLNKFGIKPIAEAEVDGNDLGDSSSQDYTSSEEANPPQEAEAPKEQEQPQDQEAQQQPQDEPQGQDAQQDADDQDAPPDDQTTDYTDMDDDMGDGGDDGGGGDQAEEPPAEDQDQPVDDIKQKEEELIGLSTTHLDIKHKELKTQFLNMYDIITSIIERIDDASIDATNIKAVNYISDTLATLKIRLSDYMEHMYSTKSYIENSINYNRFLAVLNGVQKILEEMNKNADK